MKTANGGKNKAKNKISIWSECKKATSRPTQSDAWYWLGVLVQITAGYHVTEQL